MCHFLSVGRDALRVHADSQQNRRLWRDQNDAPIVHRQHPSQTVNLDEVDFLVQILVLSIHAPHSIGLVPRRADTPISGIVSKMTQKPKIAVDSGR